VQLVSFPSRAADEATRGGRAEGFGLGGGSVPHMLRAEVGLLGRGSESTAGRHNGGLLFSRRRDSLSGEGSWIPSPSSCC
jgi:hypothetical protein